jgi:Tfp pilus assembly protein PilO
MLKLLLAIVFVGAGIVVMQTFIQPAWVTIQSLQVQIKEVDGAIGKANKISRRVEDLQRKYQDIKQEELERIRRFLPAKANQEGLLVDMDILAKEANVKLNRIVFAEATAGQIDPSNAIQTLQFTFDVAGNYESFRRFVASVEKNLRVMDITDITLNRTGGENYLFTVTGKTYYQKEQLL